MLNMRWWLLSEYETGNEDIIFITSSMKNLRQKIQPSLSLLPKCISNPIGRLKFGVESLTIYAEILRMWNFWNQVRTLMPRSCSHLKTFFSFKVVRPFFQLYSNFFIPTNVNIYNFLIFYSYILYFLIVW